MQLDETRTLDFEVDDRRGAARWLFEEVDTGDTGFERGLPDERLPEAFAKAVEFGLLEALADERLPVANPVERGEIRKQVGREAGDPPRNRDVQTVHARVSWVRHKDVSSSPRPDQSGA
ncbi:hypothetical protein HFX_0036 [Haloferax mediterranei ATCC 33500]|uniref:Uncharacterized protein n=1 Tax=Haloferax mediterranei (strain ATCC 33500 / DSM 1411 / JCM 8866 / NBRC 14739 / NCIMB 2177 / R-4) TaxID=523841 RepID=I3R0L9_HALMT|nr:hypothetical protein HFX_0036 [Haloferax mediterranei ATCC 33500]